MRPVAATALLAAIRDGDWSAAAPLTDLWEEQADPRADVLRGLDRDKVHHTARLLYKLHRGRFPPDRRGKAWDEYLIWARCYYDGGRDLVMTPSCREATGWFCRLAADLLDDNAHSAARQARARAAKALKVVADEVKRAGRV